jgi:hypothetical protein
MWSQVNFLTVSMLSTSRTSHYSSKKAILAALVRSKWPADWSHIHCSWQPSALLYMSHQLTDVVGFLCMCLVLRPWHALTSIHARFRNIDFGLQQKLVTAYWPIETLFARATVGCDIPVYVRFLFCCKATSHAMAGYAPALPTKPTLKQQVV